MVQHVLRVIQALVVVLTGIALVARVYADLATAEAVGRYGLSVEGNAANALNYVHYGLVNTLSFEFAAEAVIALGLASFTFLMTPLKSKWSIFALIMVLVTVSSMVIVNVYDASTWLNVPKGFPFLNWVASR
jgi:hypothetical protein